MSAVAGLWAAPAAFAQSAVVPSYRSATCNAFCDLWTAVTHGVPTVATSGPAEVGPPVRLPTAPAQAAAPKDEGAARKGAHHPQQVASKTSPEPARRAPVVRIGVQSSERETALEVIAALGKHHVTSMAVLVGDGPGQPRASNTDLVIVPAPLLPKAGHGVLATVGAEPLHLVAGPDIKTIEDLRGRQVSLGPNGSASQVVARLALKSLGIEIKEVPLDPDNAVDALRLHGIDALALVAATPSEGLTALAKEGGFHLVSLPAGSLGDPAIRPATIAHADYPDLVGGDPVRTVAVEVALVANEGARMPASASEIRSYLAELGLPHAQVASRSAVSAPVK